LGYESVIGWSGNLSSLGGWGHARSRYGQGQPAELHRRSRTRDRGTPLRGLLRGAGTRGHPSPARSLRRAHARLARQRRPGDDRSRPAGV